MAGFIQDNERKGEFTGCEYDRILVFDDNTAVRCTSYNYTYSYRPDAYVFMNRSNDIRICIEK
ncbi:hypothetical protein [Bradyrhizobium sp. UFLA05-112]